MTTRTYRYARLCGMHGMKTIVHKPPFMSPNRLASPDLDRDCSMYFAKAKMALFIYVVCFRCKYPEPKDSITGEAENIVRVRRLLQMFLGGGEKQPIISLVYGFISALFV